MVSLSRTLVSPLKLAFSHEERKLVLMLRWTVIAFNTAPIRIVQMFTHLSTV